MNNSLLNQSNQILILPYTGEHLWEGKAIAKIENKLSEEDLENLYFCIAISGSRNLADEEMEGPTQLMEIAFKAMSPSINDPGTAPAVITNLGQLIRKILVHPLCKTTMLSEGNLTLMESSISGKELMRIIIQPNRNYFKTDISVLQSLVEA